MNKFDQPIFITGCPRSGTSMITGVISFCGVFTGDISKPVKNDTKGLKENTILHKAFMKPFFNDVLNCDPKGQYPIPVTEDIPISNKFYDDIYRLVQDQGYKDEQYWMYKSNLLSLCWPIWNYAFPDAKWLIVRRRTGDIIQSCLKTSFMQAYKDEEIRKKINAPTEKEAWKWWVRQYENKFVEMITEGLNVKIVWPERMVNGDYRQIHETIDWLGLKWDSEIYNYIDPKFWKVRRKQ